VAVYALAKRAPFSEAVLLLGGGALAVELARQIRTRPDLALRLADAVVRVQREARDLYRDRGRGWGAVIAEIVVLHLVEVVIWLLLPHPAGK